MHGIAELWETFAYRAVPDLGKGRQHELKHMLRAVEVNRVARTGAQVAQTEQETLSFAISSFV